MVGLTSVVAGGLVALVVCFMPWLFILTSVGVVAGGPVAAGFTLLLVGCCFILHLWIRHGEPVAYTYCYVQHFTIRMDTCIWWFSTNGNNSSSAMW